MSRTRRLRTLSQEHFTHIRDVRAGAPGRVHDLLSRRRRRESLSADGKLFIIAADHPARGALAIARDSFAMADRCDLLDRLATALSVPGVDGVLGTADIIDDLAILELLDDRVVVGSMNRGGLAGASFEMDDRFTGYTIGGIVQGGLDFAKALLRIDYDDPSSVATIEANARAVNAAVTARVPIMLEPFISRSEHGHVVNDISTDAQITAVSIASALGTSSAYTWLKLPVVDDMERLMAATTLPTVLLGGNHPDVSLGEKFDRWGHALALPGVRGLTVGRALLYPQDDDVYAAVDRAAQLVHPNRMTSSQLLDTKTR